MKKRYLAKKAAAWAACTALACSLLPAAALAADGGDLAANGAQGVVTETHNEAGAARLGTQAKPKLKDYSWAKLKSISKKIAAAKNDKAGLKIAKKYGLVNAKGKLTGATKSFKLTDGTKASVRILGFRHDRLASGKLAGISFEFANVPVKHAMNKEKTNKGGWKRSDMRSWLNKDFYKMLPSGLRKQIAPAKKRTNNVGFVADKNDTSAVSVTKDKLWLLSLTEVYSKTLKMMTFDTTFDRVFIAEGKQYQLYSDKRVAGNANQFFCAKKMAGANIQWSLRSPYAYNTVSFRAVLMAGNRDSNGLEANNLYGVSPGFCF